MPITKATGYKASDGVVYATIEEARRAELMKVFSIDVVANPNNDPRARIWNDEDVAEEILANADIILSILTTGPRSRPSTRKRAGTTNPRRATKGIPPNSPVAKAGFAAVRSAVNQHAGGGTNATRDADVPAEPVGAD